MIRQSTVVAIDSFGGSKTLPSRFSKCGEHDVHRATRAHRYRLLGSLLLGLAALPAAAQMTEIPETVPPGRFLLEMNAVDFSFDRRTPEQDGAEYSAVGVGSTFVSTGLTSTLDVQVGFELFWRERYKVGGARESNSGIGDVYLRTKWNFWQDDTTGVSAAVIPYIKVPTNSGGVGNDATEGGIVVPWSVAIGGGASFAAMAAWDVVRNDDDNGYDSSWFASAYLYRSLTQAIGAYVESSFAMSSASASRAALTVGAGATWELRAGFWLDCAVYSGLTRGATDWNPVARLNWNF